MKPYTPHTAYGLQPIFTKAKMIQFKLITALYKHKPSPWINRQVYGLHV